jgi:predicted phage terminase large subunit-like protein
LQAVTEGQIKRLLINMPPRTGKTTVTSICWPAWTWTRREKSFWSGNQVRFLCGSYGQKLSFENSNATRRVILSPWYQERWGKEVRIADDQNTKEHFDLVTGGQRIASSVGGSLLGIGGDIINCFPYHQTIVTESGPVEIGDIVKQRRETRVWSYNRSLDAFELKDVIGWHTNPPRPLLKILIGDGTRLECTADHRVLTSRGYVEAGLLRVGDDLLAASSGMFVSASDVASLGNVEVFPPSAVSNAGYGSSGNVEFFSEYCRGIVRSCRDLQDNFFCKVRGSVAKVAVFFAIGDILRSRSVFEIIQSRISSVSVFVAHFASLWRLSYKGLGHELMAKQVMSFSVPSHGDAGISFVDEDRENSFFENKQFIVSRPRYALDAAEAGNFVKPFEPDDISPSFLRVVGIELVHDLPPETYCITVRDNGNMCCGDNVSSIVCANCDDPHNTEEVESEADRLTATNWWNEIKTTRLNDPKQSAIVVNMQRLHGEDISGQITKSSDYEDWVHYMVPMEHDTRRHCVTVLKWDEEGEPEQVWEDPRTEENELMWPERFGPKEVHALKIGLGPYMASGRLQQLPTLAEGGIIKETYWQDWPSPEFPAFEFLLASADTAYTEKEENDPSACTIWGVFRDTNGRPKAMLVWAWRKFLELHGVRIDRKPDEKDHDYFERTSSKWGLVEWLAYSCKKFKVDLLLVESKASGMSAAQELRRLHGDEGWGIRLVTPEGDKVSRAHAVEPAFAQGLVYAPDKEWADLVIEECREFPKGRFRDLTDSTTQAIKYLRDNGLISHSHEHDAMVYDEMLFKPKLAPLYGTSD